MRPAPDINVGIDVGAAEAVDRLLWVANHEQCCRATINAGEDLILNAVGILELVDHGEGPAAGNRCRQAPIRSCHSSGGATQQVVQGEMLPLVFLGLDQCLDALQGMMPEPGANPTGRAGDFFELSKNWMLRHVTLGCDRKLERCRRVDFPALVQQVSGATLAKCLHGWQAQHGFASTMQGRVLQALLNVVGEPALLGVECEFDQRRRIEILDTWGMQFHRSPEQE